MLKASLLWAAATLIEATILKAQENVAFVYAAVSSGVKYAIFAGLIVAVWTVCDRLHGKPAAFYILGHILTGVVVLSLWQGLYIAYLYWQLGSLSALDLQRAGWWQGLNALLTYTVVVVGITATQTARRLAAQQARASELALLAREAELSSLKAQLRPHFLFNTLNSIYALIRSQPGNAQEMVSLLADLLRKALDSGDDELVPLHIEMESVETYLQIERMRFGDRLITRFQIDERAAHVLVPPLILQPLVENAVRHGIAPLARGGEVEVEATLQGSRLQISVRDTGAGLDHPGVGHGLDITRRRLQTICGAESRVELRSREPRGSEAVMIIPLAHVAGASRCAGV